MIKKASLGIVEDLELKLQKKTDNKRCCPEIVNSICNQ